MPFRWFKRHEKKFLFFVCIVIVPTFGISYGVFSYFSRPRAARQAASYEILRGHPSVMTLQDLQQEAMQMPTRRGKNLDLVMRRALLEEADVAGIQVSDEEARDAIASLLRRSFPDGYSVEDYKTLLARNGWSVADYERMVREDLAIERLKSLKMSKFRFLTPVLFREFAAARTEVELEYVAFRGEDFESEFSIFDFEPDEVAAFFKGIKEGAKGNGPDPYAWCRDRYVIPESYTLEVLQIAFADVDPEANASLLAAGEKEPSDDDLRRYYALHSEWFPAPPEENGGGEAGAEAEGETSKPEPLPFEKVRDTIRIRVRVERGFDAILSKLHEEKTKGKEPDLKELAASYGIVYRKLERVPMKELEADEGIGHDEFAGELEGVEEGDFCRTVGKARPDGVYLFRYVSKHPEEFKELAAVKAQLRRDLALEKARGRMREEGRKLFGDVRKEFEEMIRSEIEKEKTPASDASGEAPAGEATAAGGDEEKESGGEAAKPPGDLADEEKMIRARINGERERMIEVFDRIVEERGIETHRLGPSRLLRKGSREYDEETDPAARYLLAQPLVSSLQVGQVTGGALVDRENWVSYVVALVSRKEPQPSEATAEDFDAFRREKLFRELQLWPRREYGERKAFVRGTQLAGTALNEGGGPGPGAPPRRGPARR